MASSSNTDGTQPAQKQKVFVKFQSIQGLRALAALMVIIFHSKIIFANDGTREKLMWLPGFSDFGDFGVSLFFVISGFIIANVVDKPNFSVVRYFYRRFLRIYPLLWIVMLTGIYHYYLRNWFAGELADQGMVGMVKSFLTFPQKPFPFWNPGWTLEHEVLFYIIAAIVAPLVGLRWLAVLLLALGTAGVLFNFGWNYHLTDTPQIYFAAGIGAYLSMKMSVKVALLVAVIGIGMTYLRLYGVFSYNVVLTHYTFSSGAAALIVVVLALEERHGVVLPAAITSLGDASYSLYLWHWMLIPVIGMFYGLYGGPPELWRWTLVAASITVSFLSFQMIEKPIIAFSHRKWRWSPISP